MNTYYIITGEDKYGEEFMVGHSTDVSTINAYLQQVPEQYKDYLEVTEVTDDSFDPYSYEDGSSLELIDYGNGGVEYIMTRGMYDELYSFDGSWVEQDIITTLVETILDCMELGRYIKGSDISDRVGSHLDKFVLTIANLYRYGVDNYDEDTFDNYIDEGSFYHGINDQIMKRTFGGIV